MVPDVHKRLVGEVGASGQSALAHEVSHLETLIRHAGLGVSRQRYVKPYASPLFSFFLFYKSCSELHWNKCGAPVFKCAVLL